MTMLSSEGALQQTVQSNKHILVLHFTAPWSEPCKTVTASLHALSLKYTSLTIYQVDTENVPKFCEEHNIESVPTCLIFHKNQLKETVCGLNVPKIAKTVDHLVSECGDDTVAQKPVEDINERCERLTKMAKCVTFIKGSPQAPKCKFTRALMELFAAKEIEFSYFDILADNEVREGLKKYAEWPSYPQVWHDGELIGGLDIIKEMDENGELVSTLPVKMSLDTRLKNLINSHKIMLFMKGNVSEPRCGFSKTTVALLSEYTTDFNTFDILSDNEVRQGLKVFSEWPTFPQLYVGGEFIGGLDILKEMHESGELGDILKLTKRNLSATSMKLESKDPGFSLFNPSDNCLPTEERAQFRSRANDVFAALSRDNVAPSDLTPVMAPPALPPPRGADHKVNIGPSPQLYASLVSDKAEQSTEQRQPRTGFGSNKRCYRAQHEIHPNKFTKYTLRDTDLSDDSQNKEIALGFLRDLKKDKEQDEEECTPAETKITFCKRRVEPKQDGEQRKVVVGQKNAFVKEEYVIGRTKSVSKRRARDCAALAHDRTSGDSSSHSNRSKQGNVSACYLGDEEETEEG